MLSKLHDSFRLCQYQPVGRTRKIASLINGAGNIGLNGSLGLRTRQQGSDGSGERLEKLAILHSSSPDAQWLLCHFLIALVNYLIIRNIRIKASTMGANNRGCIQFDVRL
jgi:hypothetical protein